MNRSVYDEYLRRFNAKDYAGVLDYYAEEFEIAFAGVHIRGRDELFRFYEFLHRHVKESITVTEFVADDNLVALEGIVRIEGIRELTADALAQAGYPRLHPIQVGQVIEIPQLIHYKLRDGKFIRAVCAVVEF